MESSSAKKRADFDLNTTWIATAVVRVNQCETGKPLLVMETAASLTLFIFLFDMQMSSKNGTIFSLLPSVKILSLDPFGF